MSQPRRLPSGGRIDRSRILAFTFDGVELQGHPGDTLAAALLANGVDVVGRGVESGRPRGVFSAGVEEPNALVDIDGPGPPVTLARATTVELVEGLIARSLQGRGRLRVGMGPRRSERRHAHCDVLVVGAGPAGLAAALAAGRTGARVILADERWEAGGSLLDVPTTLDGAPAEHWVRSVMVELAMQPEVCVLPRTVAIAVGDHGYVVLAQDGPAPATTRTWHVRAGQIVLCTGAVERSIPFAGNDRPGVMLAGAVRTYLHRSAVRPGDVAVVFTTDDSGLATGRELEAAGATLARVVDARRGEAVVGTGGASRLTSVTVAGSPGAIDGDGVPVPSSGALLTEIACDLLAIAGGWNPAVQLFSQGRGEIRWAADLGAWVPAGPTGTARCAGAANGSAGLAACLAEGAAAGALAARRTGWSEGIPPTMPRTDEPPPGTVALLWSVPPVDPDAPDAWATHYVDLERDVTIADVRRALDAGLRSVEHIKRYTTIGTGSDQGRTSWTTASAVAAGLLGLDPGALGVPTFRAPVTPVAFAHLAAWERGALYDPVRQTPMHAWHVANGAVFEDVGQWKRPRYYPRAGEDMAAAVLRECRTARTGVAVVDVSTLGKIDVQGPDAGVFLDRVYTNTFSRLAVGSCRYGLMCRLDGTLFDDGVTSRVAPDRFHMTTTTGNAATVLDHLEEWLQTEWPDLRVRCTSVTDQWAVAALVGPGSRAVLAELAPGLDVSREGFPFMTWRDTGVAGRAARVSRISFSGELAYEIGVPWTDGPGLWEAILDVGAAHGITPYGTETLHVLRAEKGYPVIGQETDGTVTPQDLGLDWAVSTTKDFIGRRSQRRAENLRADRRQLVGLLPVDPDALLLEGAQLVDDPNLPIPMPMVGHVTSSYRSAALGRTFALALVQGGRGRIGETVQAPLPDRTIPATIASSVLFDPDNVRRDG